MIPILYGPNETQFVTQGLGALSDVISCKVKEALNGGYELEMKYPMDGIHFSDITDRCLIWAIPSPYRKPQPFEIYDTTSPLNGIVTIYAQHIGYKLSGIPLNPFTAASCAGAMSGLSSNAAIPSPFTFWTDKTTQAEFAVKVPTATRSALGGQAGSILDVYGGEYEWDRFEVKLHQNRGQDNGVTIRYGKNLTNLEQERNIANVATGIYPYWAGQDGTLVVCNPTIINAPGTYDFARVIPVDFSQDFQEQPTPEQLQARAESYVTANNIGVPSVSIDVSFVQLEQTEEYKDLSLLERCDLGDTVTVQYEKLGVNAKAKIVEIETDVLLEKYDSVKIGSVRSNLADTVADQQKEIAQKPGSSAVQQMIDSIAQAIVGSKGGSKVDIFENGKPTGTMYLDTDSISTAKNVMILNNEGIAFSNSGASGPWTMALGIDGKLANQWVSTWELDANIIKAGILQSQDGKTFYLDLTSGILNMQATSLTIQGQTVDQIAQEKAQAAQEAAVNAANQNLQNYAATVTSSLQDLQGQIDGQIQTWFENYLPTADNAPANEWTTADEKNRHLGDLFYVVDNQEYGGQAYRWADVNGDYQWVLVEDTAVAKALAAAAQAQDTADGKRRVFVTQPVPPYDVGDLWAQGSDGSLLVCQTAKAAGEAYSASDWVASADYVNALQAAQAGRNLLENSAYAGMSGNTGYSISDSVVAFSVGSDNFASLHIPVTDYALSTLRGKTVAVSYDYQITQTISYNTSQAAAGALGRLFITFADGTKQYIGAPSESFDALGTEAMNDFIRVSAVGTIQDKPISSAEFTVFMQYATGSIQFRHPKVEYGNAASPWTPAPEDTVGASNGEFLTQTEVFNKLTNNGALQGLFMQDGKLYINATYLAAGIISSLNGQNYFNLETGDCNFEGTFTSQDGGSFKSIFRNGGFVIYYNDTEVGSFHITASGKSFSAMQQYYLGPYTGNQKLLAYLDQTDRCLDIEKLNGVAFEWVWDSSLSRYVLASKT